MFRVYGACTRDFPITGNSAKAGDAPVFRSSYFFIGHNLVLLAF